MQEYSKGKLPEIVQFLAEKFRFDKDYATAVLYVRFPQLKNHERCANCDASMAVYNESIDGLDCSLLIAMADQVRSNLPKFKSFTEANQVHVPSLPVSLAVQCRTTKCRTLGLVAKVKGEEKEHIAGTWLITNRGWSFLRGNAVPAKVSVFRNKIVDHKESAGLVTVSDVLNQYAGAEKLPEHEAKKWFEIEKYYDGRLL